MKLENALHYDLPFDQYLAAERMSRSMLADLGVTPLHFWERNMNPHRVPREETPALRVGRAIHTLVLQPENFAAEFAVAPICDRRTKVGKALWEEFLGGVTTQTILTAEEHDQAQMVSNAVSQNPLVRLILEKEAAREVSVFWTEQGVPAKARFDLLSTHLRFGWDLKSTLDASERSFQRSAWKLGYFHQADWYMRGARAVGSPLDDFYIQAVEKVPPFAQHGFRLDTDGIRAAGGENDVRLALYKECLDKGSWPGYRFGEKALHDYTELAPPHWVQNKIEDPFA